METLLPYLKAELRITWATEDADLLRQMSRGAAEINRLVGADLDYITTEGEARGLLFDYVRYARNNASEYFRENYRDKLTSISLYQGVLVMEAEAL